MEKIKIFAPASVANVSCGFDVLGFCLDPIGDIMHITKINKPGVVIRNITGEELPKDPLKNVAIVAANSLLESYPTNKGFIIDIEKKIKPGSGIGSSAASAAGSVFAINQLLGKPFTEKELLKFAMDGEAVASGAAHADNLAPVLLGGFTLVRSNSSLDVIKLPTPPDLFATIIHPKIELKTIHSRAILKKEIPLKKAVKQWGNLGAFVSALHTNDYKLLSRSMKDEVIEPFRAMLIPKFNDVRNAAIEAGALGSGISGSGPSIYALSKGENKAIKVGNAMKSFYETIKLDFDIHISSINKEGIKVL